ncbi:MAG TPA: hypothetical protein DDY91_21195 [Planctomycetaceae bacterium]|nr:hypothetical protein [Planctomycetaceae bacterium]
MSEPQIAAAPVGPRSLSADIFQVCVLYCFAVVQPAFDLLGKRDSYVIDIGASQGGLIALALVLMLVVPLLLAGVLWGANRLSPGFRDGLALGLVWLLGAMIAFPLLRHHSLLIGWPLVGVTLLVAVGCAWAFARWAGIRRAVTWAGVGCLLFPLLFFTTTRVSRVLFGNLARQTTTGKPIPVVMVVFDEFCGLSLQTADRQVNEERFPHFAELSRRATWYRNATTVNAETACVVPAILTGRYYDPTGRFFPTRGDQNLFNLVMGAGEYEMIAFEPVSRLAFEGEAMAEWQKPGIWQQLQKMLPEVGKAIIGHLTPGEMRLKIPQHAPEWWGYPKDGPTDETVRRGVVRWGWSCLRVRQFEHFLECLEEQDHPALHFMHIVFPHVPWMYLEQGEPYGVECGNMSLLNFETDGLAQDLWGQDREFVTRQQQRYLLQVQLADRLIGRLIERLESLGMWDDCLLIVTSDHGVSFRAGQNRRYFSGQNADEILSVPLFVKLPGQQQGGVSDRNVECVDLFPTVADVVGIPLWAEVDGESLAQPAVRDQGQKKFAQDNRMVQFPTTTVSESGVVAEWESLFGRSPADLYRIGPHPELLGKPASTLIDEKEGAPGVLELYRNSTEPFVLPEAPLPCYFEGTYRPDRATDAMPVIALAINGVIESVAQASPEPSARGRWESLVPRRALNNGPNEARFYLVVPQEAGVRLIPCPTRRVEPVIKRGE